MDECRMTVYVDYGRDGETVTDATRPPAYELREDAEHLLDDNVSEADRSRLLYTVDAARSEIVFTGSRDVLEPFWLVIGEIPELRSSALAEVREETAWDRAETDACERGTAGCSVRHTRDSDCATW